MGAITNVLSSPYTGFGLSALGTGMQTGAAYRDAEAQNMAAQMNALGFEQDAQIAEIQAQNTRKLGGIAATDVRREYQQLQGAQRAEYGASGVNVNVGSPAAMQADTAAEGVYEANKTRYQHELQAWAKEREADNLRFKAVATRSNKVNPYIPAATAAIGGLTSMYSTYGNWNK